MSGFTLSRRQKMFHVTFFAIKNSFVETSMMVSVGKSQVDSTLWNKIHDQEFA